MLNQDELFGESRTSSSKEKFSYQTVVHYFPKHESILGTQSLVLQLEREQERFHQQGASFPGFDPNQRQKMTTNSKVLELRSQLLENISFSAALSA